MRCEGALYTWQRIVQLRATVEQPLCVSVEMRRSCSWRAPVGTGWILQSFRAINPAQHQQKCFLSCEFFSQGTSPCLATPAPSEQGEDGKDGASSRDPSQVLRWWGGPGGCTTPRSPPGRCLIILLIMY